MSFFGSLMSHKKTDPSADEIFQPLLDVIVEILGPEITRARDYRGVRAEREAIYCRNQRDPPQVGLA